MEEVLKTMNGFELKGRKLEFKKVSYKVFDFENFLRNFKTLFKGKEPVKE